MKIHLSLLFAIACLSTPSYAAVEKPGFEAVVVKTMDAPLPHDEDKREKFLWDNFANKPDESKFTAYTIENWKNNYALFGKALLHKAIKQKLDSASLQKILDSILNDTHDKIAYLPVGACQATLDGNPVWIITIKWEVPAMGAKSALGHIRMFAFDQKTLKLVGFSTCM